MEAVLRLVEDPGLGSVDHFGGDLLTPMGREAVQEDGVGIGQPHDAPVHTEAVKDLLPRRLLLLLAHGGPDIGSEHVGAFGGLPWDGLEAIRRWSPTDHTAGMHTPTLVIHGEKDYRVVVTQGLELYGLLKARGVDARLVYYPDEGHWILKPQNSLHWHGEFLGWLERLLGTAE